MSLRLSFDDERLDDAQVLDGLGESLGIRFGGAAAWGRVSVAGAGARRAWSGARLEGAFTAVEWLLERADIGTPVALRKAVEFLTSHGRRLSASFE
ncbi:hypothetical protein CG747_36770 [Streptomyces sp. CB02959]|nr:hypothetical protein CG747_36770 [Streptomyces sp. CB02959]